MRRLAAILAALALTIGGALALAAPANAAITVDNSPTPAACWGGVGKELHFEYGKYKMMDAYAAPQFLECPHTLRHWSVKYTLHFPVNICRKGYWRVQFRLQASDDNEHRSLQYRSVDCPVDGWVQRTFPAAGVPVLERAQHPAFYGWAYLRKKGKDPRRWDLARQP